MSNGLADRFKRSDESVMDMMKRIKEEITTDATADQWQSKLEEFGVVFSLSWQSRRDLCLKGLLLLLFKKRHYLFCSDAFVSQ